MNNWRVWIFRVLIVITSGFMIASFTMPWWTASIISLRHSAILNIYGWGIPAQASFVSSYIVEDVTATYQTQLAWAYVAMSITAAIASTWLRGKTGQFLLGLVGTGLIAYTLIAVLVVISGGLGELGIALRGASYYSTGPANINASLGTGFYLACITGGLYIILGLSRNIITSKF